MVRHLHWGQKVLKNLAHYNLDLQVIHNIQDYIFDQPNLDLNLYLGQVVGVPFSHHLEILLGGPRSYVLGGEELEEEDLDGEYK